MIWGSYGIALRGRRVSEWGGAEVKQRRRHIIQTGQDPNFPRVANSYTVFLHYCGRLSALAEKTTANR